MGKNGYILVIEKDERTVPIVFGSRNRNRYYVL